MLRVLKEGHLYMLENGSSVQTIQFLEKEKVGEGPVMQTVKEGTTNEEIIAMLLNRINNLNNKFPCRENSLAVTKLQEALFWLEERTKNRVLRGVEGQAIG